MTSGQVPLWVPLAVGALGIIGVVVGQLINARLENRRWIREREREDLRWERERGKDREGRVHDARMQWREHRASIYGDFLVAFDVFHVAATDRAHLLYTFATSGASEPGNEFDQFNYDRLEELATSLAAASAPVDLAATKEVREAAVHMVAASGAARMSVRPDAQLHEIDTGMFFLYEAKEQFLTCARRELGVDILEGPTSTT